MDMVLSISTALVGLAAGWLQCFKDGKPTWSGWLIIFLIVTLTLFATKNARESANQINSLKSQNSAVRMQVEQANKTLSQIELHMSSLKTSTSSDQTAKYAEFEKELSLAHSLSLSS